MTVVAEGSSSPCVHLDDFVVVRDVSLGVNASWCRSGVE